MQFTNVIKSELYKNFCRKSTCILLIPVLLSFLITLGFRTGAVSLSMTGNSSETLSCMDYLFMNWMVLSSSGIIGLLFLFCSENISLRSSSPHCPLPLPLQAPFSSII